MAKQAGTLKAIPKRSRMARYRQSVSRVRTIVFIAFRQLWSRKLLNGIAVGGVALGVLVLIAMNGIMQGMQQKFLRTMLQVSPHMVIHDTELHPELPLLTRYSGKPVAANVSHAIPSDRQARIKRPLEVVRAVKSISGVIAATPSLSGQVLIEFGGKTKSIELRGIDVAQQEKVTPLTPFVLEGKLSTLSIRNDGIAIGSGIALDLNLHMDDIVHAATPGGSPMDLKVVAIYESGVSALDKTRGYSQLRTVQTLLGRPDSIGQIEVRLDHPYDAIAMTERVERIFGYDAESWEETNAGFLGVFKQQDMVVGFVIGAILIVGGFGILAIQIMIVLEKTRDIAILRSIGFRRADIMYIFLLQGVLIALTGGITGNLLGKLALIQIAKVKVPGSPMLKTSTMLVWEDPSYYVQGMVFALLVGTLASLLPAWRGARVEPVDVLRGQIG
jgi:lipoprotein-releasing system permease protein